MMQRLIHGSAACAGMIAIAIATANTAPSAGSPPTFAKDVAPILFEKCVSYHRAGEIGPMPLLSYEDARPWAKAIKIKVVARDMPPWGADRDQTLPMRNDRSLTEHEIETISAWVDAGAPRGNDVDLPPKPTFKEGWTFGRDPDFVFELPLEFEVPAEGEIAVQNFYTKVPWPEDRFAEVVELRPGNRAVVHHAGIYFVDLPGGGTLDAQGRLLIDEKADTERSLRSGELTFAGSSKLLSFVPGRGLDQHRPDVGKRIPAGKYINWQMRYNPIGRVEKDRTRLGIWFNKVPVKREVLIRQAGDPLASDKDALSIYRAEGKEVEYSAEEGSTARRRQTPNIPPHAANWRLTGITPVTEDITLYAMSPHMHLRGKSLKWVVTYPDGREQTILNVPKFDFNWQINYELAEPLRILAGSKITGIGVYDNSLANKWNPAPHLEVYWSEQSWDEMYQPFTEYSIDSQDLTKSRATQQQQ
jgi:hypothetical protein